MANIGYLNPESLLPSVSELAGGDRFANPVYTAFQAQGRLNMATPFLDEALKQSQIGTESAALGLEKTKAETGEFLSPTATQLRQQERLTGIEEQLTKNQLLKNQRADAEAAQFYPTAKNALVALQKGDTEAAAALYKTYVDKLPEDQKPPQEGRSLTTITGELNPKAVDMMQYTVNKIDTNPQIMQAIQKEQPELASRQTVANIGATAAVKSAEIHANAQLEAMKLSLDKSEYGLFRQVLTKYNEVGWDGLGQGDKLMLREKITQAFNASPYAKIATQVAGTLGLLKGLSGEDSTAITNAATKSAKKNFAEDMGIDPKILDAGGGVGGKEITSTPGAIGKGKDYGPAPVGAKEGQEGTGKNGEKVIVINGRLIGK